MPDHGDAGAFRALVDRATPRLFRVAAHITGDRDEADDVVQETFIRAWTRIGDLRDPAAEMGWLVRIAQNVARDRARARRRRGEQSSSELLAGDGPTPAESLEDARLAAAVRAAVAGLADKHRIVLLLREVDGMSYQDIASTLDIPVGTAESRAHRARTALSRRLERMRKAGRL